MGTIAGFESSLVKPSRPDMTIWRFDVRHRRQV